MKKTIVLLFCVIFSFTQQLSAQEAPPLAFSYMAIIKKSNGQPLVNKTISLKASILAGSVDGTIVYSESHSPTTSNTGQIEVFIGKGSILTGVFSEIEWGINSYFIKTEVDITGGANYQHLATTQLLSVPYSLFAGKVASGTGVSYKDLSDTPTKLSDFTNDSGFLKQESDPAFSYNFEVTSPSEGQLLRYNSTTHKWENYSPIATIYGQYFYCDKDNDQFGDIYSPVWVPNGAEPPQYFIAVSGDCDDNRKTVYPGSIDICDDIDNDCDGEVDEDCDECFSVVLNFAQCIVDCSESMDCGSICLMQNSQLNDCIDMDCLFSLFSEYSEEIIALESVEQIADFIYSHCATNKDEDNDNYTLAEGDCDDNNPEIHPGAVEICGNTIDEDCNGRDRLCNDNDDDGYVGIENGGDDCDDADPLINPGAAELLDGIDNNCNGEVDEGIKESLISLFDCFDQNMINCPEPVNYNCLDEFCNEYSAVIIQTGFLDPDCTFAFMQDPGEAFWAMTSAEKADSLLAHCGTQDLDKDQYSPANGDCDDSNALVHPGATEICGNGIDEDCNGKDQDCNDMDDDGYIAIDKGGNDCDDNNPSVNPGAQEICNDGIDQDCDGSDLICVDNDEDGWFAEQGDCDDNNPRIHPGAPEICDNIDNDCNGEIDDSPGEGFVVFVDEDGDGFGVGNWEEGFIVCEIPEGYSERAGDCDDSNPNVFPEAPEICDGLDNDCDGSLSQEEEDYDGDGYVPCMIDQEGWQGSASVVGGGDCNDDDPAIFPGADEICDYIDNDCDGSIDEDITPQSTPNQEGVCAGAVLICVNGQLVEDYTMITDYETIETKCDGKDNDCDGEIDENCPVDADGDGYKNDVDCNDDDASIHPGAIENCGDGIDQDCTGYDEMCPNGSSCSTNSNCASGLCWEGYCVSFLPVDNDGDGFYVSIPPEIPNYQLIKTDCNDGDASVHPNATEIPGNDIDEDCNGFIDCYNDADNDNFGSATVVNNCTVANNGIATQTGFCSSSNTDGLDDSSNDCNDANASVNPGALEIPSNGVDDDCDGIIDENP